MPRRRWPASERFGTNHYPHRRERAGGHRPPQTGVSNQPLLDIIREHSVFLQLKRAGVHEITFANTYTQRFFESGPRWISATTAAVEAAGLRFNTVTDLQAGHAVYQDFTNAMLIERGEAVARRSPEVAGEVLAEDRRRQQIHAV